ncbi:S-layer homology domain-containing protein [Chakrabartyella piscis]|uniref:S-layer homology domain-containing protein n=1 Tax=Chakrabartyella piscis TaxID=2918914 RepID=UPI00295832B0|nr:S-layer homology domain-containing protein [Chakrabartyella piscis]
MKLNGKSIKKIVAQGLALSLVLTVVPVAEVEAADYKYIKVSSGFHGDVTPDGGGDSMQEVKKFDDITFVFSADNGYQVKSILVDGEEVGNASEYTFEDVVIGHTLHVTFEKKPNYGMSEEEIAEAELAAEEAAILAAKIKIFNDVETTHEDFDGITYVYEEGIMSGLSEKVFAPDASVTRGMITAILYRLSGSDPVEKEVNFTDVSDDAYYAEAVRWASAKKIVSGYDETTFAPNATITNQELIALLYRFAKVQWMDVSVGEDTNILSYEDVASISEYAIPAYQWACACGLVGDGTTLEPRELATRGEVATILMKYQALKD